MTRATKAKFQVIHSLEEIPTSFASEDDERDWWAEHELSREAWDQMMPTWQSIRHVSPLYMRATNLAEVDFALTLAQRHLALIQRLKRKPVKSYGDVRLQHAAIAIVFTAAALEAGLNLFLAAPVLLTDDEPARRNLALAFSQKGSRLTAVEKLDLAWKASPLSSSGKDLFPALKAVFARRDSFHGTLTVAQLSGDRDKDYNARTALIPQPADIDSAMTFYDAARAFLDDLRLAPPGAKE
jgi:hypothetical protein